MNINGRKVNVRSIEMADVNSWDYPDFADAYFEYAEFEDGTELSDEELIQLADEYPDMVNELAHESFH